MNTNEHGRGLDDSTGRVAFVFDHDVSGMQPRVVARVAGTAIDRFGRQRVCGVDEAEGCVSRELGAGVSLKP